MILNCLLARLGYYCFKIKSYPQVVQMLVRFTIDPLLIKF